MLTLTYVNLFPVVLVHVHVPAELDHAFLFTFHEILLLIL